jgi:hypothetical protein
MDINQRSRKPFRGALEAADLSDLISPAVKYSRDRTSALRGLFGGNGRDDFDFLLVGATSATFLIAFFGFFAGANDVFIPDLAFFEDFLGMFAENDHWGGENSIA